MSPDTPTFDAVLAEAEQKVAALAAEVQQLTAELAEERIVRRAAESAEMRYLQDAEAAEARVRELEHIVRVATTIALAMEANPKSYARAWTPELLEILPPADRLDPPASTTPKEE